MYNIDVICWKCEVINNFHISIILEYCCKKYQYVIKISSDDMVAKFDNFVDNIMKNLYVKEILRT